MLHHLRAATSSQVKCISGVCTVLQRALCRMLPTRMAPCCILCRQQQLCRVQLGDTCTFCRAQQESSAVLSPQRALTQRSAASRDAAMAEQGHCIQHAVLCCRAPELG